MIFQLCDGDITKREKLNAVTYAQAVKWFLLNAYRNHMMDKEEKHGRD